MENISLVSQITDNRNGGVMAHIGKYDTYRITFDVVGECTLELKHKDASGKTLKTLNTASNVFIGGSYSFFLIATKDGFLTYDFGGSDIGMVDNIKVMKGGK